MAVSLSSDLIADVMRNADPARRQMAVARLQSLGSGGTDFASTLDKLHGSTPSSAPEMPPITFAASPGAMKQAENKAAAFQGFERMVLRNLFETLLPDEKSGAFGGGPSAGVWRSMAADQLAGVYAETGGLGIAHMLASGSNDAAPRPDAQWPYFALKPLRTLGSTG